MEGTGKIARDFMMVCASVAVFAATGCATTQWVKPGATAADFERDKAQCIYEATIYTQPTPVATYRRWENQLAASFGAALADGLRQAELTARCLEARGWRRMTVPEGSRALAKATVETGTSGGGNNVGALPTLAKDPEPVMQPQEIDLKTQDRLATLEQWRKDRHITGEQRDKFRMWIIQGEDRTAELDIMKRDYRIAPEQYNMLRGWMVDRE